MKCDFNQFIRHTQIERVQDITRLVYEEWIICGKLEKNWSPKTVRLHLQSMSLFLDWCVGQELIEKNTVKDIPKPKIPAQIPKNLSKDQVVTLMDWAKNYPYNYKFERTRSVAILATFIYSGLRKEELRNLKVTDMDFESKSIFVKCGKGGKDRVVPLHPGLIIYLEDYLKDRRRLKKMCPYFFTAMRQDSRMGENVIKRLVVRLREKSGIYFYPHILRHTFATMMLEGGCNLYALSKMLGHSDIKTTTIYLSATKSHLQDQIIKHPMQL